MKLSALVLAGLAILLSSSASAGPNAGGTLVAHDTGLSYTSDSASYPSAPPSIDPPGVDNQLPPGVPADAAGWVWKVYAAFATGSSPRLKALCMGEQFGGDVVVLAGGLPSPSDFEITQDGWPTASGGGVGLSFWIVQTSQAVECYWFGGYGYQGGIFAIAPHPTQQMRFVDDSAPPLEDPIAGLSTIGFGVDGQTSYPTLPPPLGACCFPDGHCEYVPDAECAGVWYGEGSSCTPNPCPPPPSGACCDIDGSCWTTLEDDCWTGVWLSGVACDPNPCPQPPYGACCFPDGRCESLQETNCGGMWLGADTVCDPNPCPQPPPLGACCYPADGHCEFVEEAGCPTGDWRVGVACDPNPCPQPPYGACCYPDGQCDFTIEAYCPTGDWRVDVSCDPNPCPPPPPGACCHPDGACEFVSEYVCSTGDWREGVPCEPNPCPVLPLGACCFPDGTCAYTFENYCPTGDWREGIPCDPNPCPQPPPPPPPPPCACPPGTPLEGEPPCVDDYVDLYNGGCNSQGWTVVMANNGNCGTMCGRSCTYLYQGLSYRDTDWYEVSAAGGWLSYTCTAQFPLQIVIIYGLDCWNLQYIYTTAEICAPASLSWFCSPGQPIWLWAGPSTFSGVPESDYVFEVCGIQGGPTPVEEMSWGAIKARFRGSDAGSEGRERRAGPGASSDGPARETREAAPERSWDRCSARAPSKSEE